MENENMDDVLLETIKNVFMFNFRQLADCAGTEKDKYSKEGLNSIDIESLARSEKGVKLCKRVLQTMIFGINLALNDDIKKYDSVVSE